MNRDLAWRERKYQPPASGIDRGEFQYIAEKTAISLRVFAEEDEMRAVNHRYFPVASGCHTNQSVVTRTLAH
jgi:hypothetical protein